MGEYPVLSGVVQFPATEEFEWFIGFLQKRDHLSEGLDWLTTENRVVETDRETVLRDSNAVRLPDATYRNLHRHLREISSRASRGVIAGTVKSLREVVIISGC